MMLDCLEQIISYAFRAHREHPKEPSKAFRKWDGRTPYGMHPTWCAMTILTESKLPEDLRVRGAWALLFHDILEDTDAGLPIGTPVEVVSLVREMTFADSDEEMRLVWGRSRECHLLKLYDKVSNMLDSSCFAGDKLERMRLHCLKLADYVEIEFGPGLNIVTLARAVCAR